MPPLRVAERGRGEKTVFAGSDTTASQVVADYAVQVYGRPVGGALPTAWFRFLLTSQPSNSLTG